MKQSLSITKEHNILTNISLLCIGAILVSGDEVVRVLCSIKGDLEAYLNKKYAERKKRNLKNSVCIIHRMTVVGSADFAFRPLQNCCFGCRNIKKEKHFMYLEREVGGCYKLN